MIYDENGNSYENSFTIVPQDDETNDKSWKAHPSLELLEVIYREVFIHWANVDKDQMLYVYDHRHNLHGLYKDEKYKLR